jgi:hypothetical protein
MTSDSISFPFRSLHPIAETRIANCHGEEGDSNRDKGKVVHLPTPFHRLD